MYFTTILLLFVGLFVAGTNALPLPSTEDYSVAANTAPGKFAGPVSIIEIRSDNADTEDTGLTPVLEVPGRRSTHEAATSDADIEESAPIGVIEIIKRHTEHSEAENSEPGPVLEILGRSTTNQAGTNEAGVEGESPGPVLEILGRSTEGAIGVN